MAEDLLTADVKAVLHENLVRHRDAMLWKLEGLSDAELRRPMTRPTGTNLLGLVKHLAGMEGGWLCGPFGRSTPPMPWYDSDNPGDDMWATPGQSTEYIVDLYRRTCAVADSTVAELDLADTGTRWTGETMSLGYALVTMVGETARHAGHADVVRENLDGTIGAFREQPHADGTATEFWDAYLARMLAAQPDRPM